MKEIQYINVVNMTCVGNAIQCLNGVVGIKELEDMRNRLRVMIMNMYKEFEDLEDDN